MGMSAGQARLLSITSRLSDNELRSQTITNAKLRLATESSEASQAYMDALNTTKLMYGSYDDNGSLSYQSLTANTLLTYGDLKNQYSLVNSSGQIMLNGSDIKKYEASNSLADYLYSYGIEKTDNPKYAEELTNIYGENYSVIHSDDDVLKPYKDINNIVSGSLEDFNSFDWTDINADANFNNLKTTYTGNLNTYISGIQNAGIDLSINTDFSSLLSVLTDVPEPPAAPDLLDYAQALLSPQCWSDTGINNLRDGNFNSSNTEIWHMEHVLAQYLWASNGGTITVNTDNGTETITNSSTGNYGLSSGGGNGADPMKVRDVLANPENAELKEQLEQLYYQICLNIKANNTQGGLTSGSVTNNGGNTLLSNEEIGEQYLELINNLVRVVAEDVLNSPEDDIRRKHLDIDGYNQDMKEYYSDFDQTLKDWVEDCKNALSNFKELLENLPDREIPDSKDAKYQWYVNLYYRMGGGVTNDDGTKKNNNYKELDENLINNAEWLQFALEHGILTMEQASFTENGSEKYSGMGTYDWVSIIYTNAADLKSQEDETAIALAEVKYKNTITEIENKDKKYDQDLKKLDTEHNALQTEYESIKNTIDKNVERSFKAFS